MKSISAIHPPIKENADEMRAPRINYWRTLKPVHFILSYVLSVTFECSFTHWTFEFSKICLGPTMLWNKFDIAEIEALWLSRIEIWGARFMSMFSVFSVMAWWIAEKLFMLIYITVYLQLWHDSQVTGVLLVQKNTEFEELTIWPVANTTPNW